MAATWRDTLLETWPGRRVSAWKKYGCTYMRSITPSQYLAWARIRLTPITSPSQSLAMIKRRVQQYPLPHGPWACVHGGQSDSRIRRKRNQGQDHGCFKTCRLSWYISRGQLITLVETSECFQTNRQGQHVEPPSCSRPLPSTSP